MRTVFLEFRDRETKKSRVVGSDAIFYLDGRWNYETFYRKAREKEAQLNRRDQSLELYGWVYAKDQTNTVHHFPWTRY